VPFTVCPYIVQRKKEREKDIYIYIWRMCNLKTCAAGDEMDTDKI
jgi:hypothetical protein